MTMSYETAISIASIVNDISTNRYVMPSIQREFVWSTTQIEQLFDSVLRGYPIGSFLFWEIKNKAKMKEFEFYEFLKNYNENSNRHNPKANLVGTDTIMSVLDGQQRLTALYIGLKGTYAYKVKNKKKSNPNAYPERRLYLNIVEPLKDDPDGFQFSFLTKEEVINTKDCYWFEVGKILDMDEGNVVSIMNDISFEENEDGTRKYTKSQGAFSGKVLMTLLGRINKEGVISYYKETSTELDSVLNIFIRVNSGGTRLSYTDLLMSLATAQWKDIDARKEINDFVDEANKIGRGFNIDKDFVLRSSLFLSDLDNVVLKVDNFNIDNMKIIENRWEDIKESLRLALNLLSSFGYSAETLKTNNVLIPIAYYLQCIGLPWIFTDTTKEQYSESRKMIRMWTERSILKKVFTAHPESALKEIRALIKSKRGSNNEFFNFPYSDIVEHFKGKEKSIVITNDDVEQYLELGYKDSDTWYVLSMMYPNLDFKNNFHMDHIYPKSKFKGKKYLRNMEIPEDLLDEYCEKSDSICNLQFLEGLPNEEKSNTDFDIWFNATYKSEEEKEKYISSNYLPKIEYSYDNFLTFIEKRREKIKNVLLKKFELVEGNNS